MHTVTERSLMAIRCAGRRTMGPCRGGSMGKTIVKTNAAPKAIGPYNQGIVAQAGRLLFTAGQIPLDPETGEIVRGEIESQTRRALQNLKAIVEEAGSGLNDVVKTTVYLKNIDDFTSMNAVYESIFKSDPPARSVVEVSRLPKDVLIEIDCIAVIP